MHGVSRFAQARLASHLLCFVLLVLLAPAMLEDVYLHVTEATAGPTSHSPPQSSSASGECAYLRLVPADSEIDPGFLLPIPPSWPESLPVQSRPESEGLCHPLGTHKPIIIKPPDRDLPDSTLPAKLGVAISVR
jgi:hypothetical protein